MNTLKSILTTIFFLGGITFAQEEAEEPVSSWNGEFSTDITFGDTVSFTTPYTGLSYSGEGWKLTSHLSEGNVNVEEAYYNVDAKVTSVTLGQQGVPLVLPQSGTDLQEIHSLVNQVLRLMPLDLEHLPNTQV